MAEGSGEEEREPTFYETLGVDEEANAAEIRAAYRERAKDTHPDVSDAPDAGRRFRRVKHAREVLTDDAERRRYDRLGHEAYLGLDGAEPGPDATASAATGVRPTDRRTAGGESASTATGAGATGSGRRSRGGTAPTGPNETPGAGGRSGNHGRRGRSPDGSAVGSVEADPVGRVAYGLARWLGLAGALVSTWQSRLGPAGAATALATFAAYPVLLASSVTPLFPLPVNILVGLCTLAVLGYLIVRPAVGVAVLGTWLLALPVVLTLSGVGALSLGGVYALTLTGVSLVLCVATLAGVSV
jgi:hypothetical protein